MTDLTAPRASRAPRALARLARYGAPLLVAVALLASSEGLRLATVNQLTSLLLLAVLAMSWNLVSGFGGQFSLGHSIFVGVGGYATAVILDLLGLPLVVVLVLSGVIAALIGVVLAYPMLRLRGPYFAIGTLGLALAVQGWMLNWDFTRASQGYSIPLDQSVDLLTVMRIAVVLALVAVIVSQLIVDLPLGLRLLALRDNEDGALALGVRRLRTLLPTWAISAFLVGVMGAVVALQNGQVTPQSAFSIQYTLDAVIICVIGGLGTLYGPLIGAVAVFVLRQFTADFAGWASLIEAIIVILIVRFAPDGAMGVLSGLSRLVRRALVRRRRLEASSSTESTREGVAA
ncbi:branched-chain amino acid ABC transporter permease [Microcella alkalica]|uniref:branched-chain amino acid ABC transporter permease n=1 Tax=Microcella alkalica TaxID=355930 RepID=UPI00145F8498|nr:branched-chain amino acid ABC transporter permease [Microcella alkalica]